MARRAARRGASAASQWARRHLVLFAELSREALASGQPLLWKWMPKHHVFVHLGEEPCNPRLKWNYGMEAEIGRAARLAGAVKPSTVNKALMEQASKRASEQSKQASEQASKRASEQQAS